MKMKIAEFVELYVYDGIRGQPSMVNLTKVTRIVPDKTWTRILFENKEEIIITSSYDVVVSSIKLQLND